MKIKSIYSSIPLFLLFACTPKEQPKIGSDLNCIEILTTDNTVTFLVSAKRSGDTLMWQLTVVADLSVSPGGTPEESAAYGKFIDELAKSSYKFFDQKGYANQETVQRRENDSSFTLNFLDKDGFEVAKARAGFLSLKITNKDGTTSLDESGAPAQLEGRTVVYRGTVPLAKSEIDRIHTLKIDPFYTKAAEQFLLDTRRANSESSIYEKASDADQ